MLADENDHERYSVLTSTTARSTPHFISYVWFLSLGYIVLHAVACSCDTAWMKQILTDHFSQARHHETNPAYKAATMRFIRDQFQEMGLETHIHNFSTEVSTVSWAK